jgi:hypothetical protein
MIGGHRWRTIKIEGDTVRECRRCKERRFEPPSRLDPPVGTYVDSFSS